MLQDGCSPITCPEMRSVDCQYLCATHDKPRECPATDYIVHTLDYTIALLNSSKLFPSRYTPLSWFCLLIRLRVMIQDGPMQYLHSSARRLYRIFIHAYEHHNDAFRTFEVFPTVSANHLTSRMKRACTLYSSHLPNSKSPIY
jgi:Mob1/phocein family